MQNSSSVLNVNSPTLAQRLRWTMLLAFGSLLVLVALTATSMGQDGAVAADGAAKVVTQQTLLGWLYSALGWEYLGIFTALSFILVALVIMNVISARRESVCPPSLIEGFEAHLDNKEYQGAYELSKTDESFLGNVLAAGLARLSSCLLYTSPSPRDKRQSRMPSSA